MEYLQTKLSKYVVCANDIVFLKMIKTMKDLEENDENSFKPLMSHQVFGET